MLNAFKRGDYVMVTESNRWGEIGDIGTISTEGGLSEMPRVSYIHSDRWRGFNMFVEAKYLAPITKEVADLFRED